MRGTSKKLIMQDCKNYARNENSRIFVYALREKCPNTEFFWSVFFRIWTEYGDLRSESPYSVRIWGNTDQKKLRIWTLFTQCVIEK